MLCIACTKQPTSSVSVHKYDNRLNMGKMCFISYTRRAPHHLHPTLWNWILFFILSDVLFSRQLQIRLFYCISIRFRLFSSLMNYSCAILVLYRKSNFRINDFCLCKMERMKKNVIKTTMAKTMKFGARLFFDMFRLRTKYALIPNLNEKRKLLEF